MPDLLLIEPDNEVRFALEALATSLGVRSKTALDMKTAIHWLETKQFDCVISHIGLEYALQQRAAEILWRKNQIAPYIVIDWNATALKIDRGEYRLLGAEVVEGSDQADRLTKILGLLGGERRLSNEGFRILVVEDLDSPRDIICSYIERLGFPEVQGSESAVEALELLQAQPGKFSCVITDVNMPQVSGTQLITTVRGSPVLKHIPIIVLTAYGTADCLIDCLRAGASGFLVKPPSRKDLEREIGRAVRIVAKKANPRMAEEEDAEKIRLALMARGFC